MEKTTTALRGIYRDRLQDLDGNIIYDSDWKNNTIVNGCRVLLAGFMKGQQGFQGIKHMVVGSGKSEWDNADIEPAALNDSGLVKPIDPVVENMMLAFLDDNDQPVNVPTMRLQITAELKPNFFEDEKPYPLREFGLFGSFGNEDYMINVIRHPVIYKDSNSTLIRKMRLYF